MPVAADLVTASDDTATGHFDLDRVRHSGENAQMVDSGLVH